MLPNQSIMHFYHHSFYHSSLSSSFLNDTPFPRPRHHALPTSYSSLPQQAEDLPGLADNPVVAPNSHYILCTPAGKDPSLSVLLPLLPSLNFTPSSLPTKLGGIHYVQHPHSP